MKGVILAAGKGKRLRPLSHTMPKPLLPIANQPMISYGIKQLIDLGITEIGIVIHPDHEQLFKEKLSFYTKKNVKLSFLFQQEQKGISHAVKQAKHFIGSDSFVLLLGDNIIAESLEGLRDSFQKKGIHGAVMVAEVMQPRDYGIAEMRKNKIVKVVEKPADPPSNLAVIGAYMFNHNVFKAIDSIIPSARGEYEITDAIQWLIDHHYSINYTKTEKPTFDVGTVERWLHANRWLLQHHVEEWGNDFEGRFRDSIIIPPVSIGDNCHIKNAVIGPYVSIGSDVTIQKSVINNSILLKGSQLTNVPYELKNSIIGENAKVMGDGEGFVQGIISDYSSFIFRDPPYKKRK